MVFRGLRFIPVVVVVPLMLQPHRSYQSAKLGIPRLGEGRCLTDRRYSEERKHSKTDKHVKKTPQGRPDFWYQRDEVIICINEASLFFVDWIVIVEEPILYVFSFMARSSWIRPQLSMCKDKFICAQISHFPKLVVTRPLSDMVAYCTPLAEPEDHSE